MIRSSELLPAPCAEERRLYSSWTVGRPFPGTPDAQYRTVSVNGLAPETLELALAPLEVVPTSTEILFPHAPGPIASTRIVPSSVQAAAVAPFDATRAM